MTGGTNIHQARAGRESGTAVRSYRVVFCTLGIAQEPPSFLAILTPYCLGFQKSPSAPSLPICSPLWLP